jgi:hypothetical protein
MYISRLLYAFQKYSHTNFDPLGENDPALRFNSVALESTFALGCITFPRPVSYPVKKGMWITSE